MRIVAGAWRGRSLRAPAGGGTRPTAGRVRQALFDMLLHAPWGGPARLEGALVLDAFAGTGALGLEALSRGAARAVFLERERDALAALRANITALGAETRARVVAGDGFAPPAGEACALVFLDPPYGPGAVARAAAALTGAGWIAAGALVLAEMARGEAAPEGVLAERAHGAARLVVWEIGRGAPDDPKPAPPPLTAGRTRP